MQDDLKNAYSTYQHALYSCQPQDFRLRSTSESTLRSIYSERSSGPLLSLTKVVRLLSHVQPAPMAVGISKKDRIIYGPCRPYICSQGQYWASTTIYAIIWASTTIYAIIWAGTKPYISQQEMQCHTLCVKEYLCIK